VFKHHGRIAQEGGDHSIDLDGVLNEASQYKAKGSTQFIGKVMDNTADRRCGNLGPKLLWNWPCALVFAQKDVGGFEVQHVSIVPPRKPICAIAWLTPSEAELSAKVCPCTWCSLRWINSELMR